MFAISMAVQPGRRHGVDIGAIVKKALRKALDDDWLFQKQAALTMGTSMASFSRALDGQPGYPLDLWKFAELDPDLQEYVYARILEALREDRKRMARMALPSERKVGAA